MKAFSIRDDLEVIRSGYDESGFVIVRDVIPSSALDAVHADMRRVLEAQAVRLGGKPDPQADLYESLVALHGTNLDIYLQSVRLVAKLASVFSLFLEPNVARLMAALGVTTPVWLTSPVLHVMSGRLRIPGGYFGVDVHQDWPALQSSLDAVTGWIPLFDVSEGTYPMEVAPRSHLLGLLPGKPAQHVYEIEPDALARLQFVPLAVPRGGIAMMSGFTVHRSNLAGGDSLRVAFSHRYENALEPSFVARGFPSAQSRTIRRELLQPGFPTPEQVGRIYGAGN